ncbi:MAG: M28 family peptidase [Gemmataceae bacterium]|nr:M28 family peptidase [Gemmataceae bacterium]
MYKAMLAAAVLAGGFAVYYFGFRDDVRAALRAKQREVLPASEADESDFPESAAKQRTEFAQDRDPGGRAGLRPIEIDGKRAMGYLERVCAIGPRQSGTPGMKKQQELLRRHFEDLGLKVAEQKFSARQRSQPNSVEMTNLIVAIHPERKRRVILCSHYDTRPIADQEPDPRKWREPFVSANDGGSGVALLMEFGHHLPKLETRVGIDLVFFDGEEYIFDPGPDRDRYFFGSEHFAKTWKASRERPDYIAAILFDMIAGKNPRFPVEGYSWLKARDLCIELWTIGRELKCKAFLDQLGDRVLDDHISLQNVGIPAVDIIDFEYPHWHRLSDVPANCDADGLIQVARVVTVWLQRVK